MGLKSVRQNVKDHLEELKIPTHLVMNRIIFILLGVFIILEGIILLERHGFITLPPTFLIVTKAIVIVILSFVVVSTFIRITEGSFEWLLGKDVEIEQRLFFTKMYGFTLYVATIAFILYYLGVSASNISLIIGLIATGVAFAIREVLVSYMVWFMLLTKKPFRIGDYIQIAEHTGKVLHIGTFYVILDEDEEIDSEVIRVPNKIFLEQHLENYGPQGVYLDKAQVQFREMPKDMESRVRHAERAVAELTNGKGKVYLDNYKEYICLVAKYPVRYSDRHEMRKKVILALGK
jgi:small-conductance mechanosensitive channel